VPNRPLHSFHKKDRHETAGMTLVLKPYLLATLLSVLNCKAERWTSLVEAKAHDHFSFLESDIEQGASRVALEISSNICGGPTIRNLITKPTEITGVRLLPATWTKIMLIADEFIHGQTVKMTTLDSEIRRLAAEVKQLEAMANVDDILPNKVMELVTAAVTEGYGSSEAAQSFGPLKVAQESQCSFQRIRHSVAGKRVLLGKSADYQSSESVFRRLATDFFTGKVRSNSNTFMSSCMAVLDISTGDVSQSSCDELCNSFANTAQELSDSTAGNTGVHTATEKSQLLAETVNLYKFALQQKDECEAARVNLASFGAELTELNDDIARKAIIMQQSQDMFDEADMAFEDLQADLARQAETTRQIQAIFAKNSLATSKARQIMDEAEERKLELQEQLRHTTAQVEEAGLNLRKAIQADEKVSQLKTGVSEIMLKMMLYYDDAVRAPMSDLGLSLDTNIAEYFNNHVSTSMDAMNVVASSVQELSSFCEKAATPVFQGVTKVDLSPLCRLPRTAEEINMGIHGTVDSRRNAIKTQLEETQSYLYKYKGNEGMTDQEADRKVNAWEPRGLQEVKGTFDKSPFWEYLQEWQLEGTFHSLYKSLGEAVQELTVIKNKAAVSLELTDRFLKKALKQTKQAQVVLKKGIEELSVTASEKRDAEEALALLEQESAWQAASLESYQLASKNAMEAYEYAKKSLMAAHSAGISTA